MATSAILNLLPVVNDIALCEIFKMAAVRRLDLLFGNLNEVYLSTLSRVSNVVLTEFVLFKISGYEDFANFP